MNLFKLFLMLIVTAFVFTDAASQNALINILTKNSGIVKKGEVVFLEVTVNNTDATSQLGVYKIKTQVSIPSAIVKIAATGHVLPTGWIIISNNGSTITLSNGKDIIAATDARSILIAMEGISVGGPSTITGSLSFSNGKSPGIEPGSLPGDNTGDNSSTSSIKVIK